MRFILPRIVIAISCITFIAANSVAGETGVAFLKISCDAATGAMGEVQSLYHGGDFSSKDNAAIAPTSNVGNFALTNNEWLSDTRMTSLAATIPIWQAWINLDLSLLEVDEFELRPDSNPEPEGEFSQQNFVGGISFGAAVTKKLNAGFSVRRVQEKIYDKSSNGWSVDLGTFYKGEAWSLGFLSASEWRAGVSVRNLGEVDEFVTESPGLPRIMSVSAGCSDLILPDRYNSKLVVEYKYLQDDDSHLHLGMEIKPYSMFKLRAGWMTGYDDRNLTLGFGLAWRSMKLDYAWLPIDNELGDSQKFTFSFSL
jgi:hypothetical protein